MNKKPKTPFWIRLLKILTWILCPEIMIYRNPKFKAFIRLRSEQRKRKEKEILRNYKIEIVSVFFF